MNTVWNLEATVPVRAEETRRKTDEVLVPLRLVTWPVQLIVEKELRSRRRCCFLQRFLNSIRATLMPPLVTLKLAPNRAVRAIEIVVRELT